VEEPGAPAGRVVAVRAAGRDAEALGPQQLARGQLAISITIQGVPVGDLPEGTRLRLGTAAIVELSPPAGARGAGPSWEEGAPAGLLEAGGSDPVAADVLEPGPVALGDPVSVETIVVPLTDVLDLHSFLPQDTPRVVVTYLEEARRAGLAEVRIVHGRGRGVQRAAVRRVLREIPGVAGFADAPPTRGGWGATIVRLGRTEDAPSA
jgi:Smr domain